MKEVWHYRIYRAAFGTYLLHHFLGLLPWGTEIFSSAGVLPNSSSSPLMRLFPNLFLISDAPRFVASLLMVGAVCSLLFMVGKVERLAALVLWFLWASLYGRNPLIANPSLPFVGWLLLSHAVIGFNDRSSGMGGIPKDLFSAAWILMALSYSYSGYTKLISPSWLDGTALSYVLSNPLARATVVRVWLLSCPPILLKFATWSTLGLELIFAPVALFRRIRPWIWLAMVGLHLGLVVLVNFADLTLGMLIVHMFTFDPAWLTRGNRSIEDATTPAVFSPARNPLVPWESSSAVR
ncbi:MAG TPA: hypothetical protein VH088_17995 [Terriglobales bacterium]|nr:hypothetical protein [Terriglobales bacterium]